ncbi:hypothetical protein ACRQ5Q_16890 [Bradyrhizobium sp. PMVTL-01]|uniref:hypothetical protein n=1 Tax=Bradyrhizobium sp. PMVTL-01 TaxID=3434999 RepID=UPI003F6E4E2E
MPGRKYPSENKEKLALRREERRAAAQSQLERLVGVNDRSHSHLRKLAMLMMDVANDPVAGSKNGTSWKRSRRRG